ncbi:MAG: tetratricopeptide repeat protein, partial [Betaproteobacteria bacterium]|nr:tetratricopeptide repeat protein [Betaproteobacteria bacterium]
MTLASEFDRAFRLHQQGKLREAFLRYDAILKADPRHAPALHYSGVVLHQSGKHAAAAERIRAAIAADPASADAWSNLALVLQAVDRPEAAVNALMEAVKRAPHSPEIWCNLAAAHLALHQLDDAETSARQAIAADPRHAAGWYHLALALEPRGRTLEALDAATRAHGITADIAAYAGLKAQLEDALGSFEQAKATLTRALVRNPTVTTLRFELAALLERRGEWAEAADSFEQVLRTAPNQAAALSQLLFLRQRLGDWHDLPALRSAFKTGVADSRPLLSPFVFLSQPVTRAEQRRCAETWIRSFMPPVAPPARRALTDGRLKIGYLSADFHTHATAHLTAGLFEHHDRRRFDVVAYSAGPDDASPMRSRLRRAFDRFIDVRGAPPAAIADTIRRDGIDLLVDLKGHTEGILPAVLARRPAPIQVHYLGYPGTLGGNLADYLIGDGLVTPPAHAVDYAETLIELPDSYQVNDNERAVSPPPSRQECGLPATGIVFCCFNGTYKINPEVFDSWANILVAVPHSSLWLLARNTSDQAVANLRREASARAIDPERVIFAVHRPHADYLGLYRHA